MKISIFEKESGFQYLIHKLNTIFLVSIFKNLLIFLRKSMGSFFASLFPVKQITIIFQYIMYI